MYTHIPPAMYTTHSLSTRSRSRYKVPLAGLPAWLRPCKWKLSLSRSTRYTVHIFATWARARRRYDLATSNPNLGLDSLCICDCGGIRRPEASRRDASLLLRACIHIYIYLGSESESCALRACDFSRRESERVCIYRRYTRICNMVVDMGLYRGD